MAPIEFIKCQKCVKLPRPNCPICLGLGGEYFTVGKLSVGQEISNKIQIESIKTQYQMVCNNVSWPPKLKSYLSDSIPFLEQYKSINEVNILVSKIERSLKAHLERDIKAILLKLKAEPSLEYILGIGSKSKIHGSCVSFLDHQDMLRVSLFSEPQPLIRPRLRVLDIKQNLVDSSAFKLTDRNKLIISNSIHDYDIIAPNKLAVVKICTNHSSEYFYILRDTFDNILKDS